MSPWRSLFHASGTLWIGGRNPIQLDLETGEEVKKIVHEDDRAMGHDRCYRNYITERYFINSKTGGADFLDLKTGGKFPNHWTRGGCGRAVLPANGLGLFHALSPAPAAWIPCSRA